MFVAVGNPYTFTDPAKKQNEYTGTMATSSDGITWVPIPYTLFSKFATGIACNGLIWVAVGSSNDFSIAWSQDGKNWIKADNSPNMIFSQGGTKVKWNGNLWVAMGGGGYSIAWSLDGKIWKGVENSRNILLQGRGISWNGKSWLAVGSGNTYSIATSQDGKNWKGVENSVDLFVTANAIACNKETCVAVGVYNYQSNTNTSIAISIDGGITWKGIDNSQNIFVIAYDVAWTGSYWIAVGSSNNPNPIAISQNGNDWTYLSFTGDSIQTISWNENGYIFGDSNGIITSKYLTTFTRVQNILTNGVLGITWW